MSRFTDEDAEQLEQALAVLSGVAPRGWVVIDDALGRVGNIKANGTVGPGLTLMTTTHRAQNLEIGMALSVVLNDAGRLLMAYRRAQAPAP